jgi:hypothetical protein
VPPRAPSPSRKPKTLRELVGVERNQSLVTQRFEDARAAQPREPSDPDARAAEAAVRERIKADEALAHEELRAAREQLLQTKDQIFADAVKAAAWSLRGFFETTFGVGPSRPAVLEATELFRTTFSQQ